MIPLTLRRSDLDVPVAVTLARIGAHARHIGLAWRDDTAAWHLDLQGHENLAVCRLRPETAWVQPALSDDEVDALSDRLDLIVARLEQNATKIHLPYGFDVLQFDEQGEWQLGDGLGTTCAELVMAIFDSVHVPLIDRASWSQASETRRAEDLRAREAQLKAIEGEDAVHATRLRPHTGAVRVRPEEVAAASGVADRPVSLNTAALHAEGLLTQLYSAEP